MGWYSTWSIFVITLNSFGISLTPISCETLDAAFDQILSLDMSELFKSTQLNGNNCYYSLVAAFRFMMLTLSYIIFVLRNLEIIYEKPEKGNHFHWGLSTSTKCRIISKVITHLTNTKQSLFPFTTLTNPIVTNKLKDCKHKLLPFWLRIFCNTSRNLICICHPRQKKKKICELISLPKS